MEKNELLAALPTVLGRHDVCNIEYFFKNIQRSAMCCLQKTSAGMQLGYKSVLFILHFHLAGMNRGEPGRTVAPPWITGKNRSVTGVLPAWTWVNRGEPAREPGEPCKRRDEPWPCRGSTWMNRGPPGCSRVFEGLDGRPSRFFGKKTSFSPGSPRSMNRDDREAPG